MGQLEAVAPFPKMLVQSGLLLEEGEASEWKQSRIKSRRRLRGPQNRRRPAWEAIRSRAPQARQRGRKLLAVSFAERILIRLCRILVADRSSPQVRSLCISLPFSKCVLILQFLQLPVSPPGPAPSMDEVTQPNRDLHRSAAHGSTVACRLLEPEPPEHPPLA